MIFYPFNPESSPIHNLFHFAGQPNIRVFVKALSISVHFIVRYSGITVPNKAKDYEQHACLHRDFLRCRRLFMQEQL